MNYQLIKISEKKLTLNIKRKIFWYRMDINDHLWFAQYRNTVKKDNGCIINLEEDEKV